MGLFRRLLAVLAELGLVVVVSLALLLGYALVAWFSKDGSSAQSYAAQEG